jgi:peptide/nickel transport system permease protein
MELKKLYIKNIFLILIGILIWNTVLFNDKPIYEKNKGPLGFFSDSNASLDTVDWISKHDDLKYLWAIIPYNSKTIDKKNSGYLSPLSKQNIESIRFRHWLGTDKLGRDVLAGLLSGAMVAFWIGIGTLFFSFLAGIILGGIAGFYGNDKVKISRIIALLMMISIFYLLGSTIFSLMEKTSLLSYYSITIWLIFLTTPLLLLFINKKILDSKISETIWIFKKMSIPLDDILIRLFEIFRSIPGLLFFMTILSVFSETGIFHIIGILSIYFAPGFAMYIRNGIQNIMPLDYMVSSKALGISDFRMFFLHAFPNITSPLFIYSGYVVSASILAESTLSFFGLGLAADRVTWGSMLQQARLYFPAWWLAVFPGMLLFCILWIFNKKRYQYINNGI